MRDLHREDRTIIMVTHNPEVTEQAERTVRLQHGSVAQEPQALADGGA